MPKFPKEDESTVETNLLKVLSPKDIDDFSSGLRQKFEDNCKR